MSLPMVIEATTHGDRSMDIQSRLLKERVIVINGEIDDQLSNSIIMQLLFLEQHNSEKAIRMYINSSGGYVTSGLAIYDTMCYIKPRIHTVVVGKAFSMASVLAQAGNPGNRYIAPNARIMVHQPLGNFSGSVSDTELEYKELLTYKGVISNIYSLHNTKDKDPEFFIKIMDRNSYYSANEAIDIGLADKILVQEPLYNY